MSDERLPDAPWRLSFPVWLRGQKAKRKKIKRMGGSWLVRPGDWFSLGGREREKGMGGGHGSRMEADESRGKEEL